MCIKKFNKYETPLQIFFRNFFHMSKIVIFEKGALIRSAGYGSLLIYKPYFTEQKVSSKMFKILWARSLPLLSPLKGILKRPEPCKCNILLVSRIFRHKRITPSLEEWRFSCLIVTGDFPPWLLLTSFRSAIPVKSAYFHWKNVYRC